MICKNCSTEFEGKFCNQCGQKNFEGRVTTKETVHNFFHAFTHVDSGMLYLIKELSYRPGFVVKDYLEGKRKKHFNPLQFLVIAVAVSTFLAVNLNLFGPKIDPSTIPELTGKQVYYLQFNNFIYKYFNIILFVSVPIAALYSRFIFRESGFNYAENFIFNAFIAGERTVFYISLAPVLYFTKDFWYIGIGFYYLMWNIYFVVAYNQFFGGNKIITTSKYILVFILLFATSQTLAMGIFTLFFYK